MSKIEAPVCTGEELHEERIEKSIEAMPDIMSLYDLSDFFKILGDSTRMGILFVLGEGQLCVCDIAKALGMTKSAVSHQLKILRQADLVRYVKSGKNVFYSLADDHVKDIIEKALEHIREN